jgi:hypothetical protein
MIQNSDAKWTYQYEIEKKIHLNKYSPNHDELQLTFFSPP